MNPILQRLKSKTVSIEEIRNLLCYDKDTGEIKWSDKAYHTVRGKVAGTETDSGYLCAKLIGKTYRLHTLAFVIHYGRFPNDEIDHINGNKKDNRIANLRDVSKSVNKQNQIKPRSDNRLGVMGVTQEKDKYRAKISIGGKRVNLGTYLTPEKAYEAYISAKRKHHIGCTL